MSPTTGLEPGGPAVGRALYNPHLFLKNVSCGCGAGVPARRGCLPAYSPKQVAQEAVARQLPGIATFPDERDRRG